MNRGAIFGSLALASLLLACGSTEVDLGTRPQFKEGGNALTILAFDGITGAAVTGAAVKIRVGSHVLSATAQSNSYSFSNLPNGTWPVFAEVAGYLAFAGMTNALTGSDDPANPTYSTSVVLMYADTQVADSYTIKVIDNVDDDAVLSGQVIVTLVADAGDIISGYMGTVGASRITGTYGYKPASQVLTLDSGNATLVGTSLIYGATYAFDVVGATNSNNLYLSQVSNIGFVPPYTLIPSMISPATTETVTTTIPIFMAPVGDFPDVRTYSNDAEGKDREPEAGNNAALTITFAQPVEKCTNGLVNDFVAVTDSGATGSLCLNAVAPPTTPDANMQVASGGLSVTLTTLPSAYEGTAGAPSSVNKCIVTYNANFKVRIVGTTGDANCVSLTALKVRGGAGVIDPSVITSY